MAVALPLWASSAIRSWLLKPSKAHKYMKFVVAAFAKPLWKGLKMRLKVSRRIFSFWWPEMKNNGSLGDIYTQITAVVIGWSSAIRFDDLKAPFFLVSSVKVPMISSSSAHRRWVGNVRNTRRIREDLLGRALWMFSRSSPCSPSLLSALPIRYFGPIFVLVLFGLVEDFEVGK